MNLIELAERCEAATAEQQRELLNEAWLLIHDENAICPDWTASHAVKQFAAKVRANAFTDAALTLVSEGCGLLLNEPGSYVGKPWVNLNLPHKGPVPAPIKGEAATLALAICAAALRARAAMDASTPTRERE